MESQPWKSWELNGLLNELLEAQNEMLKFIRKMYLLDKWKAIELRSATQGKRKSEPNQTHYRAN